MNDMMALMFLCMMMICCFSCSIAGYLITKQSSSSASVLSILSPSASPTVTPAVTPVVTPATYPGGFKDGDYISLQSAGGNLLSLCGGCTPQSQYPDIAACHLSSSDTSVYTTWKVINGGGNNKIKLQSAYSGYLLALCVGCETPLIGGNTSVTAYAPVYVSLNDTSPLAGNAIWAVAGSTNPNQITLQGSNGNYLTECVKCLATVAPLVDGVAVHISSIGPQSIWTIAQRTPPASIPNPQTSL